MVKKPYIRDEILALPIANLARVADNIVRGETLSASRNRKYIDSVKDAGVEVIIDFRTADFTVRFADLCVQCGLEYHHFPIDKSNMSDSELIELMPLLFTILDNHSCYVSCQQGMHRTDIAMAIYYMFHRINFVPNLFGHKKNGMFRCDDIMRRVNSIFRALNPYALKKMGLEDYDEIEFRSRRNKLLESNRVS